MRIGLRICGRINTCGPDQGRQFDTRLEPRREAMNRTRPHPMIPATIGALVGFIIAYIGAMNLPRHLTLKADPAGLIGTWTCLVAMGSFVGGVFGRVAALSLGGRGASGTTTTEMGPTGF